MMNLPEMFFRLPDSLLLSQIPAKLFTGLFNSFILFLILNTKIKNNYMRVN